MCLARPGRIVAIEGTGTGRMAEVDVSGTRHEVSLAFVEGASVGDYVLAHSGVAVRRLDPDEAYEVTRLLGDLEGTG